MNRRRFISGLFAAITATLGMRFAPAPGLEDPKEAEPKEYCSYLIGKDALVNWKDRSPLRDGEVVGVTEKFYVNYSYVMSMQPPPGMRIRIKQGQTSEVQA